MTNVPSRRKSTPDEAILPPPVELIEPKPNGSGEGVETEGIPRPDDNFDINDFKSDADTSHVGTLLRPLPHHTLAQANDFVRLHPDEGKYWSPELCFAKVPILGQKQDTLHLIKKEVAIRNQIPAGRVLFFRLTLAAKPGRQFFLCHVPSRNLDNPYNRNSVEGCQLARTAWIQASSKRVEGMEGYHLTSTKDPDDFLETKRPLK